MNPLDVLGKLVNYSKYIIAIAVGLAIYHFFMPSKVVTTTITRPIPVRDDGAIQVLTDRYEKQIADTISKWQEKLLGLKQRVQPTGTYGIAKPDVLPAEKVIVVHDTLTHRDTVYVALSLDVPIMGNVTKDEIYFLTRNSYNLKLGQPYMKEYHYQRVASDFSFTLNGSSAYDKLEGINLIQTKRWYDFDGFGIIAGAGYPQQFYAGVDARMIFWEQVEITPRLLTTQANVELRWKF